MAENDIRQTMMLHEDQAADFDDAWHLGDYGDGWGLYAVKADDPARDVTEKNASTRRRWLDTKLRGL